MGFNNNSFLARRDNYYCAELYQPLDVNLCASGKNYCILQGATAGLSQCILLNTNNSTAPSFIDCDCGADQCIEEFQ
jgi:hypothetical protein